MWLRTWKACSLTILEKRARSVTLACTSALPISSDSTTLKRAKPEADSYSTYWRCTDQQEGGPYRRGAGRMAARSESEREAGGGVRTWPDEEQGSSRGKQ